MSEYLGGYQCPQCGKRDDQGIEVTGERTESDTIAEWEYPEDGDDPILVDHTHYFTAQLGTCRSCGAKVRWGNTSSYDGWLPMGPTRGDFPIDYADPDGGFDHLKLCPACQDVEIPASARLCVSCRQAEMEDEG